MGQSLSTCGYCFLGYHAELCQFWGKRRIGIVLYPLNCPGRSCYWNQEKHDFYCPDLIIWKNMIEIWPWCHPRVLSSWLLTTLTTQTVSSVNIIGWERKLQMILPRWPEPGPIGDKACAETANYLHKREQGQGCRRREGPMLQMQTTWC